MVSVIQHLIPKRICIVIVTIANGWLRDCEIPPNEVEEDKAIRKPSEVIGRVTV